MNQRRLDKRGQKGSVLAMSLIILLVLTVLGVNAMSSLILEEKMAGNARQAMVASQATDVALRAGEDWIRANVSTLSNLSLLSAGTVGYYSLSGSLNPPPAIFNLVDDTTWAANSVPADMASIVPAGLKGSLVSQDPRYIVEYLGRVSEDNSDDSLDIVNDVVVDKREYAFRVTAIGWGENTNARFLAQSTYRIQL